MTHRKQAEVFLRYAVPGMTLRAPEPELVKRCGCGKRISMHRARCWACQMEVMQELGSQIESQDLLDAMLDRNCPTPELRRETLDMLRPYLSFSPDAPKPQPS